MIVLFYLYTIPRFNYQNAYNSTVHLNVCSECVAMWLSYRYGYKLSMNTFVRCIVCDEKRRCRWHTSPFSEWTNIIIRFSLCCAVLYLDSIYESSVLDLVTLRAHLSLEGLSLYTDNNNLWRIRRTGSRHMVSFPRQ